MVECAAVVAYFVAAQPMLSDSGQLLQFSRDLKSGFDF